MRILIIDDELLIVKAISALVEKVGHEIAGTAGTVPRALDLIATADADLALVDVNLEGINAEPVIDRLRERRMAIIVMSGYSTARLPERMRNEHFLAKPIDPDTLLRKIGHVQR